MRVRRAVRRLAMLGSQATHGDLNGAVSSVRRWVWSTGTSIGFERDLRFGLKPPPSQTAMEVVGLDTALAKKLFVFDGLSGPDWTRLIRRRDMWREGFEGGFVAVDRRGEPLVLQWMIPPNERDHLIQYFGALFPPLPHDTFLGEGIWIPPAHRGRGMMAEALSQVGQAAHCSQPQVTREIAFVDAANIASLKGYDRAGFARSRLRTESWRAGVLRTTFTPPVAPSAPPFSSRAATPQADIREQ